MSRPATEPGPPRWRLSGGQSPSCWSRGRNHFRFNPWTRNLPLGALAPDSARGVVVEHREGRTALPAMRQWGHAPFDPSVAGIRDQHGCHRGGRRRPRTGVVWMCATCPAYDDVSHIVAPDPGDTAVTGGDERAHTSAPDDCSGHTSPRCVVDACSRCGRDARSCPRIECLPPEPVIWRQRWPCSATSNPGRSA